MTNAESVGKHAYSVIVEGLTAHPSKASHPEIYPFAQEVADEVQAYVVSCESEKIETDEMWPRGSHERNRTATTSAITLSHALEKMTFKEREHWMPPAETLAEFSNSDVGANTTQSTQEWEQAVSRWTELTIRIAKVLELREEQPNLRKRDFGTKAEQIGYVVTWMAKLWHKHFSDIPSASDGSPFTHVVQLYLECCGKPKASHPVIADALAPIRVALQEQKKTNI